MHSETHLLIASRSKSALENVAGRLQPHAYRIDTRHIQNGHTDPLWGLSFVPDILVMVLDENGHHDLLALTEEQSVRRPPLIVVAENGDAQTMRLAMQAGARDFLPGVTAAEDLAASIERVRAQIAKPANERARGLTAFVNAKGGSGATFTACNIAHISAEASGRSTALLSLDMQFDSLAQYFDVKLRHGLRQVLESVDDLDAVALDAYMTRHESGLRMLAPQPSSVIEEPGERAGALAGLLDRMMAHYEHVVVDMPRRVDAYSIPVLKKATCIVLVVEQTLGHLRDAGRMLQIFESYGVPSDRVLALVNRYDKTATLRTDEVSRALHGVELVLVPSDYKTVSESIDLGVPIYEHARRCAVTKALTSLETRLGGSSRRASGGLFGKGLAGVLRR